jgi:hypothetical protein
VTYYSALKFRDLSDPPRADPGRSRPAVDAAPKLAPAAALIVSLLLSLGLWAAIWQAVSSLAAAWLR